MLVLEDCKLTPRKIANLQPMYKNRPFPEYMNIYVLRLVFEKYLFIITRTWIHIINILAELESVGKQSLFCLPSV